MVIQTIGGNRALPRGRVPPRWVALCGCAAGVHPRQLERERAGREASFQRTGKSTRTPIMHCRILGIPDSEYYHSLFTLRPGCCWYRFHFHTLYPSVPCPYCLVHGHEHIRKSARLPISLEQDEQQCSCCCRTLHAV